MLGTCNLQERSIGFVVTNSDSQYAYSGTSLESEQEEGVDHLNLEYIVGGVYGTGATERERVHITCCR